MMASERPLQRFSDAYLERCRELSPEDIVRFLDDFRKLHGAAAQGALPNADQEFHAGMAGGTVDAEAPHPSRL
jgi:hypothetical protein